MDFIDGYLSDVAEIARKIDRGEVESVIGALLATRERGGRLFFLGVGGSAGNASHAVCDFRKIGGFEAYAPIDNISEITARTNDEGWDTVFSEWLSGSRVGSADAVFVFSVGGGSVQSNISANIVRALEVARSAGATILGVVGRDGGFTRQVADASVLVPVVNPETVTAHSEAFQAVIWHLIISDPRVAKVGMKWESTVAMETR